MDTATKNQPQQARPSNQSDKNPSQDLVEYLKDFAKERPEAAALWCLGIGFVLGWKLKPW